MYDSFDSGSFQTQSPYGSLPNSFAIMPAPLLNTSLHVVPQNSQASASWEQLQEVSCQTDFISNLCALLHRAEIQSQFLVSCTHIVFFLHIQPLGIFFKCYLFYSTSSFFNSFCSIINLYIYFIVIINMTSLKKKNHVYTHAHTILYSQHTVIIYWTSLTTRRKGDRNLFAFF